jgi:Calx-beta domain
MKRTAIVIITVLGLFGLSLLGGYSSSAAGGSGNSNNRLRPDSSSIETETDQDQAQAGQEDQETGVDADFGKGGRRINPDTYLRLRDEYVARRRGIEPGRPFDPTSRSRAIETMERQEKGRVLESIINGGAPPPIGVDAAWTPIGPFNIPNGQALNGGNISVSGRVTSIAVDQTNANKVYLGTAQGGVWRSLDGGSTWASIFDSAQTMAIGALALAPSDPTILYVGTGEFNACGDCFFGIGLYRIDTVDTTPSLVGPINPSITTGSGAGARTYNIFNGRSITKILVDPGNAATILVATGQGIGGIGVNALGVIPNIATRGVYRSTNATSDASSVSFQKLVVTTDASADSPGTGDCTVADMVIEPGTPNNLLVSVIGRTTTGGVFRSTNAQAATPAFTQVLSLGLGVRSSLAINKVGSVITLYAATSEASNNTTGCSNSLSNFGAVHKQVDPFNASAPWPTTQLTAGGGFCGGQCGYDIAIAVNPTNANEVYLAGDARGDPNSCSDGMKKSTNGGTSFFRDDSGLHADSHALAFDTTGATIFTGNDGGVWKKAANNTSASAWTNLNGSQLNSLQFQSIAVHPSDRNLMIGGTQDNGTEYQQTSASNWRNAEGGDGGYSLIDQSATDTTNVTMYHTFFNITGDQIAFDRTNLVSCLASKDSWEWRGTGFVSSSLSCDGTRFGAANGLNSNDNVLFYAPMALGPGAPNTLYFGTDRLYRSIDRGDTMTVVSQGSLTNPGGVGSPISTIAIWPQGDNIRLLGLMNGQVWATSTGSSTFVNITSGSFPTNPTGSTANKYVGRAVIDPNNKNVAYVSFAYYAPAGQGIWKITNLVAASGASPATPAWTSAANGIPSVPVNALAIDPVNSNIIYAGTDIGVYSSSDGGANWSPFGTGFPRVAVFDLQIQPTNRIMRAATHGRGVLEIPLLGPSGSTVQFQGASTQSVTEGQVSVPVVITRGGDVSFPASVNYATGDSAGANDCSVTNGVASSRCDYIATFGTLNFAANEVSKTILIPIVDDSYAEGPETFSVTLTNPTGLNVSLGSPAVLNITINDNGDLNGPNQIDATNFFVREHYVDFLNREPDAPGLAFWIGNIDNCSPKPACTEVQRINTSASFFLSIEFQNSGYLVERIYKAAFGKVNGTSTLNGSHTLEVPVIRFNEFLSDTQRIGQGVVVGVGDWQQQIENNKQAFTEEFVQRSRFLTAFPLTMTSAQFVDALNSNSGALSAAERDNLVAALNNGTMSRAQVLRAVAEDQTLFDAEFNRAFVLMQYYGYLRRNPNDAPDADYTGFDFWLTKLNQFNGNFINAEMVKAFITSLEYRKRFAPS